MVNFIPAWVAIRCIVSWMLWLNGLGTRGIRNMLLPLTPLMSMAGPGAVKVGCAMYFVTLSLTAADTSALPPDQLDEFDESVLHASSSSATDATAASAVRRARVLFLPTRTSCVQVDTP